MGALVPFAFGDNLVRVIEMEDGPRWIAKDVASILGYGLERDMYRMLDEDERGAHNVRVRSATGVEQDREMTIISESGIYNAIFNSRIPEAKTFCKWVTAEVLPTIRRTGGYHVSGDMDKVHELVERLMNVVEALAVRNAELEALVKAQVQPAASPRLGEDYAPGVHSVYLDRDDGW